MYQRRQIRTSVKVFGLTSAILALLLIPVAYCMKLDCFNPLFAFTKAMQAIFIIFQIMSSARQDKLYDRFKLDDETKAVGQYLFNLSIGISKKVKISTTLNTNINIDYNFNKTETNLVLPIITYKGQLLINTSRDGTKWFLWPGDKEIDLKDEELIKKSIESAKNNIDKYFN